MSLITTLLTVALLHPVHETVSEVEWNQATGRLEVALRLDPLDEQWLATENADGQPVERWGPKYLQQTFRVTDRPPAGKPDTARYHWVGREDRRSHVWWFFEIEPLDRQRPSWVEARMLLRRNDHYVNRVLVLGESSPRTLILDAKRPKSFLDPTRNEPTDKSK